MIIHDEGGRPDFVPPVDPLRPDAAPQLGADQTALEPAGAGDLGAEVQDFDRTPEQEAEAKAAAREAFKRRRAEREAGEARDRVAALEDQVRRLSTPAVDENVPKAPVRPNPKNYELGRFDIKYEEALDAYMAERDDYAAQVAEHRAAQMAQRRLEEASGSNAETEYHRIAEDVGKRGLDKYPDFREVVKDALEAMPIADEAAMRLLRLPNAEDVFYYLATNAGKMEQVTGLDPMDQALELGKISQALGARAKASQRPVTQAKPTPTIPRGQNGQFKNESDSRYEKMLKATRTW